MGIPEYLLQHLHHVANLTPGENLHQPSLPPKATNFFFFPVGYYEILAWVVPKYVAVQFSLLGQTSTKNNSFYSKHVWVSSSEMDDPRASYTEWSNSERKKTHTQMLYNNAYICNLEKWSWWIYLQGRNRGADIEDRPSRGRKGWGELRE